MSESGPIWEHDCNRCTFLGHFEEHDLYACIGRTNASPSSVIARYGPNEDCFEGMEHSKTPIKHLDADVDGIRGSRHLLRVAYLLAADRGLLPWCVNDLYVPAIRELHEMSRELHVLSMDEVNDDNGRSEELIYKIAALSEVAHTQRRLIEFTDSAAESD